MILKGQQDLLEKAMDLSPLMAEKSAFEKERNGLGVWKK